MTVSPRRPRGSWRAPSRLPGSRLASSSAPFPPGDPGCSGHCCPWSRRPSPSSLESWRPGGAGTKHGSPGLQTPRGVCDETAHPRGTRGPLALLEARGSPGTHSCALGSGSAESGHSQPGPPASGEGQALGSWTLLHASHHICDT